MAAKDAVFDEQSLKEAIETTWGKYGAHADVFRWMLVAIEAKDAEIEMLRAEVRKWIDAADRLWEGVADEQ